MVLLIHATLVIEILLGIRLLRFFSHDHMFCRIWFLFGLIKLSVIIILFCVTRFVIFLDLRYWLPSGVVIFRYCNGSHLSFLVPATNYDSFIFLNRFFREISIKFWICLVFSSFEIWTCVYSILIIHLKLFQYIKNVQKLYNNYNFIN